MALELLFVARRHGRQHLEFVEAARELFETESLEVVRTAAEALDMGGVPTVFDARQLANALRRRGALHAADERLLGTAFPTQRP
ncbi:MAG TPA: hypothetical protein VM889_00120 [Candidatus Thermoplasmatota archaeon]|nr:hypothetical protein [Candidatus Thermoplasmatota archaeon]